MYFRSVILSLSLRTFIVYRLACVGCLSRSYLVLEASLAHLFRYLLMCCSLNLRASYSNWRRCGCCLRLFRCCWFFCLQIRVMYSDTLPRNSMGTHRLCRTTCRATSPLQLHPKTQWCLQQPGSIRRCCSVCNCTPPCIGGSSSPICPCDKELAIKNHNFGTSRRNTYLNTTGLLSSDSRMRTKLSGNMPDLPVDVNVPSHQPPDCCFMLLIMAPFTNVNSSDSFAV